tara:strand:+ start:62 stop:256 length:195 start_codon:yes stop_codon:yes gene_type:complete
MVQKRQELVDKGAQAQQQSPVAGVVVSGAFSKIVDGGESLWERSRFQFAKDHTGGGAKREKGRK